MAKKIDPMIDAPIEDDMEEEIVTTLDTPAIEPECQICRAKHAVEDSIALLGEAIRLTTHDYSGLVGEDAPLFEVIHKDAGIALATLKIFVEMRELLLKCDCEGGADESSESGPALTDYTNDNPEEGKASPDGVAYDS